MNIDESIEGVLVLAGPFDPCRILEQRNRYDLLPIPRERDAFKDVIINMVKVEMSRRVWGETLNLDRERLD
ncbi:hypothetical protein SAMN05216386_1002 [Nitrosospira briensis]|uniref:Uncharacterized protein n=1 Tax=Nitrosospira briensis TaxID=35799 RepID=A0A1I4Z3S9_9PROT|nr:hypothetical protein [Nitrosospira briensis]SFN44639.1 hypothetical protein SAMN05216386_1002 [Nitrosospira briensis]